MRLRVLATICSLALCTIVMAGCAGQSGNAPQEGAGGEKEKTSKRAKNMPDLTTVSGTLGRIDAEKGRLTLRPDGSKEPLRLRFNNLEVTLGGKEASPKDLEAGQKVEVGYFERKDRKVARTVDAQKPDLTTANGTLGRIDTERGRLTLRPDDGGEPLRFRFNPKGLEVTLNGEAAKAADLNGGQKATVAYSERDGRKVARTVEAES